MVTEITLGLIKEVIGTELLKRGFHTPITVKYNERHNHVSITSESFQTTPVLFKSITIDNFGGSIKESFKNEIPVLEIWIPVHVSYTHFDLGSNGCSLFSFSCIVHNDKLHEITIK
jgi:hypothetical protein